MNLKGCSSCADKANDVYTYIHLQGLRVQGLGFRDIHKRSLEDREVHRAHVARLHSENFVLHGTHTHRHVRVLPHFPAHTHTHTYTYTHIHTHARARTHTHTHTHTQLRILTHTHTLPSRSRLSHVCFEIGIATEIKVRWAIGTLRALMLDSLHVVLSSHIFYLSSDTSGRSCNNPQQV
jgi:hypothetical protein